MRSIRYLLLLMLAPVSMFAAVAALNVQVVVTISEANSIDWAVADANADQTGQRTWTISPALTGQAYSSVSQPTITGPAAGAIAVPATAFNFTNLGGIAITSSITVANGDHWNVGGAPAIDVFMLKASIDGGSTWGAAITGPTNLLTTQGKNAVCNLALQFSTPTTISSMSLVTSSQTVTITATQN